ncbi:hypothetical protein BV20DRAFT_1054473 [Pilatotrama ljubarskyi]|nr:hypothetical protein BV20DRAFT_1054473 [Pilatotrama ljubarskyi]
MDFTSDATDGTVSLCTAYGGPTETIGALLIGTWLGLILYGLFVHQTYVFFSTGPKEQSRVLTGLVLTILILETLHSVFCMLATYSSFAIDRPLAISASKNGWSLHILDVLSAVIFCFTQSLFARRVALIWRDYGPVVAIIAVSSSSVDALRLASIDRIDVFPGQGALTAGQLGAAIASSVLMYMSPTDHTLEQIGSLHIAQSVLVIVASELLAGALIHRLRRSRTGYARTDGIIRLLILCAGNTGLLVGISSLLSLIFSKAWPNSHLCGAVNIVATNLYAVSLLAE